MSDAEANVAFAARIRGRNGYVAICTTHPVAVRDFFRECDAIGAEIVCVSKDEAINGFDEYFKEYIQATPPLGGESETK